MAGKYAIFHHFTTLLHEGSIPFTRSIDNQRLAHQCSKRRRFKFSLIEKSSIFLLAQAVKVLRAGEIGHGILPVDDDCAWNNIAPA